MIDRYKNTTKTHKKARYL